MQGPYNIAQLQIYQIEQLLHRYDLLKTNNFSVYVIYKNMWYISMFAWLLAACKITFQTK